MNKRRFLKGSLGLVSVTSLGGRLSACPDTTAQVSSQQAKPNGPGAIVAHGGGNIVTFTSSSAKLSSSFEHAFRLGGGRRARIVTIASREDDGDAWLVNTLAKAGYRNTYRLRRSQPSAVGELMAEDVIYIDGAVLTCVETRFMRKLNALPAIKFAFIARHKQGAVVGGTSAGAAALSNVMICCNRGRRVIVSRGLGLLPSVIIDQHYSERNRQFRLNQVITQNPNLLGIGLDEGEAISVQGGTFKAIGGAVTRVEIKNTQIATSNVRQGSIRLG